MPTNNRDSEDPFEKPERLGAGGIYDTTDGNMVRSQQSAQRSRYLKFGGIIAAILFVLYLFSPATRSSNRGIMTGKRHCHARHLHTKLTRTVDGLGAGQTASDPAAATTKCTKSYSPSKPLIQYALMIDAGSTGSRIHAYKFSNCGPTPELEHEYFLMTEPSVGGLSKYGDDPEAAAKSLDVLLDYAVSSVPESYQLCSPIAVKATAGLRKLGPTKSDAILKAVRARLETAYPFPLISDDKGGVEVMDGKDEGVYAWITTNYLLGKIGGPDKSPTAAVFDLGGGSTQIVFEPTFPQAANGGMPEQLQEGDHKYKLSFGGRDFTLYQHSYLGYGLMAARENLHKVVALAAYEQNKGDTSWMSKPVINPCVAPGQSREVIVELDDAHPLGPKIKLNMTGSTGGLAAQCRGLVEKTLLKDQECKLAPCAFNGVHQPSLEKTFAREDIYLFSFFYDRTAPLGMPESFTISELKDLAAKVCQGEAGWPAFEGIAGARAELADRPETCLDLNFMLALLHTGYEMPMNREVKIAKKIKGNELGWCLGAR